MENKYGRALPGILRCTAPLGPEEEQFLFQQLAAGTRTVAALEKKRKRSSAESSQLGIARGILTDNTRQISEANTALVLKLARKFVLPGVELDDLVQDGVEKLLTCISGFDISRGCRFSTYLYRSLIFLYLRGRSNENKTWRKRVDDAEGTILLNVEGTEGDSEMADLVIELRDILATNKAGLSKIERTVVLLTFEKTQAEISIIAGLSKAKQKEHRENAIEKLRAVMCPQ